MSADATVYCEWCGHPGDLDADHLTENRDTCDGPRIRALQAKLARVAGYVSGLEGSHPLDHPADARVRSKVRSQIAAALRRILGGGE